MNATEAGTIYNAEEWIGKSIQFAAEPYEFGTMTITGFKMVNDYTAEVTGLVTKGHCISRLMQYNHYRDIAGKTIVLDRCYPQEMKRTNLVRCVY